MSEPLQFDYHPDADQICAFVEHALPAHEREQMLDHLAVCTECRAVVALSLPNVEEPVPAPGVPRIKPWWLGWRLAWPAGLSAAALALSVFYIHQAAVVRQASVPAQIAEGRMSPPPAPARQSSASATTRPVKPAPPIHSTIPSRPTPSFGLGVESPRKAEPVISSEQVRAFRMQSRDSAVLDKPAPPPAPFPGQISGIAAGSGSSFASTPNAAAGALLQKTPPAQQPEKSAALHAPSTAPNRIAPSSRNTETVTVENAASAIQTETVDVSNVALSEDEAQITQFIQLKHPLPSGLPAVSAAAQARRIVAIDTQNGIFLSEDEGKHWKSIHTQWKGRAVRVERVGLAPVDSAYLKRGKAPELAALNAVGAAPVSNAAPADIAPGRSLAAASGSSLAGTVTDVTGAVIAGAAVSITESATHAVRNVITDGGGHYFVDGLAPGSYTVEARARGFATQRVADVIVAAGHHNVADISLKIGEESQSVTVSADSTETVTEAVVLKSSAKSKKLAAHDASPKSPAVFAITTENGERWTSTYGLMWTRQ